MSIDGDGTECAPTTVKMGGTKNEIDSFAIVSRCLATTES